MENQDSTYSMKLQMGKIRTGDSISQSYVVEYTTNNFLTTGVSKDKLASP